MQALVVKNLPANAGRRKRLRFHPWVGKIPWRRTWQPFSTSRESPWTEEPGELQSIGSQRVRHDWSDLVHTPTVGGRGEEPPLPRVALVGQPVVTFSCFLDDLTIIYQNLSNGTLNFVCFTVCKFYLNKKKKKHQKQILNSS